MQSRLHIYISVEQLRWTLSRKGAGLEQQYVLRNSQEKISILL